MSPVNALIGQQPGRLGVPRNQQPGEDLPHPLDGARHAASGRGLPGRADPHRQSDRRHAPLLLLELHRLSQPTRHAVHLSDDAWAPTTTREEFFNWPIHEGRDLTWLKNYETYASIFAVDCPYDFFGAYDVDADRGIVQVADHHQLRGKKAWTWGEWEFGQVAQQNLTDEDGPYIEVQSGPLPTQSDYGMLGPRELVEWQEWWYPVHGLGDGFEYATKDLVAQVTRQNKKFELRLLATGQFPQAVCKLATM